LLKTAIRGSDPVLFIEHVAIYATKGEVPDEDYTIPFGKGDVKRSGQDVTIVAYSKMALVALEAAQELEQEGIHAEVVDPRSLRPLDVELIAESVKKTGRAVVVTEGWRFGGAGAEIASTIYEHAFDWLDGPVARIGGADVPAPYSRALEHLCTPDKEAVKKAVRNVMGKRE